MGNSGFQMQEAMLTLPNPSATSVPTKLNVRNGELSTRDTGYGEAYQVMIGDTFAVKETSL
jgi:hypothetical protein